MPIHTGGTSIEGAFWLPWTSWVKGSDSVVLDNDFITTQINAMWDPRTQKVGETFVALV